MPMRLHFLPLLAVLLDPISALADFDDPRTHGVEARELGEDPSCELVNRAYMRTVNSGRYSVDYYQLKDDGKEVLRSQGRFIDRTYHYRFESLLWNKRQRPLLTTITRDGPVVQDCVRVGDEDVDGVPSIHFRGKWQRDGKFATIDVWIAKDELINVKTLRSFSTNPPQLLPYTKSVERYRLDPNITVPQTPSDPYIYYSNP
jgi:hypothetical protein